MSELTLQTPNRAAWLSVVFISSISPLGTTALKASLHLLV